jgi:spermidine synthase
MRRRATACALAFVSGFAALGYELVWLRRLGHLWGGSALPEMFLTTCFVVGLGVGGAIVAKRLFRIEHPLVALGAVEIAIGTCGLAFESVLRGLWTVHASLIGGDATSGARWAGAFAATAAVVVVPASLMGTTTLLLCRALETEDGADASPAGGLLFGVNAVGAGCGCLLTGFVLLPRLGLETSGYAFAAANAVVATGAFVLARRSKGAAPGAAADARDAVRVGAIKRPLAAAAVLGFLGMGLEYAWTRELVLVLGGSVYAFQSVLFVLLCGLGFGGVLGSRLVRTRGADRAAWMLTVVVVLGGVVGQAAVTSLASTIGDASAFRTHALGNLVACVGTSCVVLGPASLGMGGLFVVALAFARPDDGGTDSEALRLVGFANCAGGASAGWIVMFHALPGVGVENTVALFLVGFAVVRAFLLRDEAARVRDALLFCAGAAAAAAGARALVDSHMLRSGQFMYGATSAVKVARWTPLFSEDGSTCSVLVEKSASGVLLRVNGKVDGSSGDMATQTGLAYLPLFLRPSARDVLVVGFGTGTSSHAAALWPGTDVTCCEIEPAVVAASAAFRELNHADVVGGRLRIVEDDGRRFLQGTTRTYDLVVSEPSNPWLAGVTNLFTREFYETARSRLNPRGLFVQWTQSYSFGRDDYGGVLATVRAVFPDAVVIRVVGGDTMVVACKDDDVLGAAGFASEAQSRVDAVPEIGRDLSLYFGTSSVRRLLAGRLFLGRAEADAFGRTTAATVITDTNLRLEYDTPLRVFGAATRTNDLETALYDEISTSWLARVRGALGESSDVVAGTSDLWEACFRAKSRLGGTAAAAALSVLAPGDARAAVRRAISAERGTPEAIRATAAAAFGVSRGEVLRLAFALRDQDRNDESIEVLNFIAEKDPRDAEAAYLVCRGYIEAGKAADAKSAFAIAVAIDPRHPARAHIEPALLSMK